MLSLKTGVKIAKIEPQLVLGLICIESIFQEFGYDCVITSVSDGVHRPDSLHYLGRAVDLRIRHLGQSHITDLITALRRSLGSDFDVVLEVDHIHIEYDPKN